MAHTNDSSGDELLSANLTLIDGIIDLISTSNIVKTNSQLMYLLLNPSADHMRTLQHLVYTLALMAKRIGMI